MDEIERAINYVKSQLTRYYVCRLEMSDRHFDFNGYFDSTYTDDIIKSLRDEGYEVTKSYNKHDDITLCVMNTEH